MIQTHCIDWVKVAVREKKVVFYFSFWDDFFKDYWLKQVVVLGSEVIETALTLVPDLLQGWWWFLSCLSPHFKGVSWDRWEVDYTASHESLTSRHVYLWPWTLTTLLLFCGWWCGLVKKKIHRLFILKRKCSRMLRKYFVVKLQTDRGMVSVTGL